MFRNTLTLRSLKAIIKEALSSDITCPTCTGTGYMYNSRTDSIDYNKRCKKCKGKGQIQSVVSPDREVEMQESRTRRYKRFAR